MLFPTQFIIVVSILSILLIVSSTYSGYKDGFILKACELLSTVICIVLAYLISGKIAKDVTLLPRGFLASDNTLLAEPFYETMNSILIFIVLFIVFRILIVFVRPIFRKVNWIPFLGLANKISGMILGFIQAFIILSVCCFVLSGPLFVNGADVLEKSKLIYVSNVSKKIFFMLEKKNDELESIQKAISPSIKLEEKDYDNINYWLINQGFSESEQEAVRALIEKRNE